MDRFDKIDIESWDRAEIYKLYTEEWTTVTYNITTKLNAARLVPCLKERGIKLVPALIWLASREVNRIENFRLGIQGRTLGRWEKIHPVYPTVNPQNNMTFHNLPYGEDFRSFYDAYLKEQAETRDATRLWATPAPPNFFIVSVLSWLHFDGLNMQLKNPKGYYAPYVAMGRYNEQMELPCSIMVNHAAIDGWHVAQFFEGMQKAMDDPAQWCE